MASIKDERIKKGIEKEIMGLIVNGIKDPRVPSLFTISKVTLSKDRHYSHIYITMNGTDEEKRLAIVGLNSAKGFIQMNLAEKLQLRYTPKLEFRLDKFDDEANRVDDILKQISKDLSEGKSTDNE